MKKVFIGLLLLVVSGGVVYYFLTQKPAVNNPIGFNKELLIGKWKLDSTDAKNNLAALNIAAAGTIDSNQKKYEYVIGPNGKGLIILPGKAKADTIAYEWTSDTQLNWTQSDSAKTKTACTVVKLDSMSFGIQTKDSSLFQFTRVK